MTAGPVQHITSGDNDLLKELRKLSKDSTAYRTQGRIWVEGEHLCRAAMARGAVALLGVYARTCWPKMGAEFARGATRNIVIPDAQFDRISTLASPAKMGFVMAFTPGKEPQPGRASVILDRVQDAGNVGAILRSASAFGFDQIIALEHTAALWSPKVLRAGMGAHWGLQLFEGVKLEDLARLAVPIVVTSSHQGVFLHQAQRDRQLPWPIAWAFGHEGQGLSEHLRALSALAVRIAQPGGEESLNVAAAAAICLYASATAAPE